ncbi:MAG: tetratricopeptide repeat protein, partial [Acidobacteriaceae bacterium]
MGEPDLKQLSPEVRAGLAHHRAGRLLEAAQEYQRALCEDGPDADALLLLGMLARIKGNHEASVRLTVEAVRLRPLSASFHLSLGQAHLANGNGKAAISACRRALALDPGLAAAWCCLGEAEAAHGESEQAQQSLKTAATLDGKSARPDRLLGHLLARLGKLDEAAAAYR